MLLPSCSIHALRGKAGESVTHTHTHTHTHAYFPSCLPCMIWFAFIFIFCYCYRTSHPYKIHNTCMYKHKRFFPLSNAYARTHIDTHSRLSRFYCDSLSDVYLDALNIHLCLCCLLALVQHAGDLIRNKAASQSSQRKREREKEKETDCWRNQEGGSSSFL